MWCAEEMLESYVGSMQHSSELRFCLVVGGAVSN